MCFSAWLVWVTLFYSPYVIEGGVFVKKRFRSFTAVFLAIIMVALMFGTTTVNAATTNESVGATQKAMYIMEYLNISQGMYGSFSHQGSKAIDMCGKDGGKDPAYAPFDGHVVKVSTGSASMFFQSNAPVLYADGTVDFMTIQVIHDDNVGRFYVGQSFSQGEHFFNEGCSGNATGNHIHLECAKGTFQGQYQNSEGVWCLKNQINPYDALYLYESTIIINGYNYNWRRTTPIPTNPWISTNKTIATTGESITFTFGAENATSYTIGIDKDGTRIVTERVSSGKTYSFDQDGLYSAYVSCYNSSGSVDSDKVEFTVFKPCNIGSDFEANIYHAKSNLAVGASSDGNVLLQTRSEEDNNQKWHFQRNTDGSYRITNIGQQKCMDVYGGSSEYGANIQIWNANDTNAQQWYVRRTSTGFKFVPKCNTSSTMDIDEGVFQPGTNLKIWSTYETGAQIFNIDYLNLQPAVSGEYSGHRYELFNISTTWDQAYKICEERGGHLVTISSSEENNFVLNLSKQANVNRLTWLGGYANNNREWFWITDESISYTNWESGEPNNYGGNENRMNMSTDGLWNDIAIHANARENCFVCEYEDLIIDANQYVPVKTTMYNDSKYELYDLNVTWEKAKAICESKGGHLTIINNRGENDFVNGLAKCDIWIGITDNLHEANWKDLFGNDITYSNWADKQPDNYSMCENYGSMYADGTWNDNLNYSKLAFVCEYDDAVSALTPVATKSIDGHRYELYDISASWNQAYRFCENLGGHLATVTSTEENELIKNMLSDSTVSISPWLGGADFNSEGNWYWITGERFSYTNWNATEPNNTDNKEHFMSVVTSGKWNDLPVNSERGFICEYEDLSIDETAYSPVKTVLKNNSFYELYDSRVNWTTAKEICEQKGGHLITIESKAENDLAMSMIPENYSLWLGYSDMNEANEWRDVCGNLLSYSNWNEGEPNNWWEIEHYALAYKTGYWNDMLDFMPSYANVAFICEYDNADISIKPTNTFVESGHKYELYNTKMTWRDAYQLCEKKGGHLVTISSKNEDEFVSQIQKNYSPFDRMWLGATDENSEGNWRWITGEAFDYTNWDASEPNNIDDEDYMMMYKSSGKWNDVCDSTRSGLYSYSFICEYDSLPNIGDTNLDGNINIIDVTAIQRHLAESELFTDKQLALADTNGDGVVNITDATHLQKYLAEFDGIVLGKLSA